MVVGRRNGACLCWGMTLLLLLSGAVRASVVTSSASEFTVKHAVEVQANAAKAYQVFVENLPQWWDPAHTYSGASANMSLDAKPNGCLCEKLGRDGGIAHLSVVYVDPGKLMRMTGGLGPLQSMAVNGVLTVTFTASGAATRVEFAYAVGGQPSHGLDKLAPLVDQVLVGQWTRFARFVDAGKL